MLVYNDSGSLLIERQIMKLDILSLTFRELEEEIIKIGEPKFRAKQIYPRLFQGISSFDEIGNIPKTLKEKLNENLYISKVSVYKVLISELDGTRKYLLRLDDKNIIEAVLMKYKHGLSICISSQVGCLMGCSFCASTIDGLIRNLTAGEMIGQILAVQDDVNERISNVVMMGSGEPLDNFDNVVKFLDIVNQKDSLNIGYRHITVSTCGVVPKINELANLGYPINLAISLHETTHEKRKKIMPVEKAYSIDTVLEAARNYANTTKRRVTFEYALIQGVNDDKQDANRLSKLLKGMLCHVNLIPVNSVEERTYKRPDKASIDRFVGILRSNNIEVTVRREMGKDINGACGQLRRSVAN